MTPSLSPYQDGFNAGVEACRDIIARTAAVLERKPTHHRSLMIASMRALEIELAALRTDAPDPDGAPLDPEPPTPSAPAAAMVAA